MNEFLESGHWLPFTFAFLMALALLIYSVLDGYDLGVGILTSHATDEEKDTMLGSIGPFWDANETWLVLGFGLLLVAFPMAQGVVMGALYLPAAFMLFGLILRGVSFDFREKVRHEKKPLWNTLFQFGSLLMALSQGWMLGRYVLGFKPGVPEMLFAALTSVCVVTGFNLIGANWLIMKTEGDLQKKAIGWAQRNLLGTGIGIIAISVATPLVSRRIFDLWFSVPNLFYLAPIPLVAGALVVGLDSFLRKLAKDPKKKCWVPFATTVVIYLLCFLGLGISFYPYIVPDQITIWTGAAARSSLMFMLVGALIVLPILIVYTGYAYKVFWGKATDMKYE